MVTSITLTDPAQLAAFAGVGVVEVKDANGNVIGTFTPRGYGDLPPGVTSPISDAEFEDARKQTGGRSLAEIIRDLERKHGAR
jgi:hypothetical protein